MASRQTGTYRRIGIGDEYVEAFTPHPLPPSDPPLRVDAATSALLADASAALSRLQVAAGMVPSNDWFIYGFVRKEAVISSQIEGTQATLRDVLQFEATDEAESPEDVEEVCNYVVALNYARREIRRPKGLPISTRLLCGAHKRLMKGVRGKNSQPGAIRRSQNWVGDDRPGNAVYIPPPPDIVSEALGDLDQWIHGDDDLPPLIRAGLAHVQFETIHPFLDGNGRIGRLLVTLLVEHWNLLDAPLLYLSLPIKRRRSEYYQRLSAVRTDGDWEGWTRFFLECVHEAADDGVDAAQQIFRLITGDRMRLAKQSSATVPAVRLFDLLPGHPMVTLKRAAALIDASKPTAQKSIDALVEADVLVETTGRQRDRVYAYQRYLDVLSKGS